ncbi:hypothetical protein H4S01_005797 [Coemansia sp. RSA 2610]|nr:hypothetical protein H4S01_005797 [Coemansia sp. RSA 2610]
MADSREAAVLAVNTLAMGISTAIVALVLVNRDYIPLRSKNIPLVLILYVSTVLWFIGDVFTYYPALVGKLSRPVCILAMSWLRISLGVFAVVSCHVFRIYQYVCIFEWRVRAQGWRLYAPLGLLAMAPVAYGGLASGLPASKGGNAYMESPSMCVSHKPLYFAALGMLLVLLLCWLCAILAMRRIYVCFSEFREMLAMFACTVVIVVLQAVLRWVPGIGDQSVGYNAMVAITDMLVGNTSLAILLLPALWHCYRDRDAYLRFFLHKLKRENRQTEYELANGEALGRISTSVAPSKDFGVLECEIESPTEWTRGVANELCIRHESVSMQTDKRILV